jgi:hypothetical protein
LIKEPLDIRIQDYLQPFVGMEFQYLLDSHMAVATTNEAKGPFVKRGFKDRVQKPT